MSPELAQAFAALTTGIYVLTVRDGDCRHGMSSSWVTQVSADPPLLMAAVDCRHLSHGMIERSGCFALNVVGHRGKHLEAYFYSATARCADNLGAVTWDESPRGLPLLRDALVCLECRVQAQHRAGDHSLFVALVERVVLRNGDRPLTSQDLDYVYVGQVVKRRL